MRKIVTMAALLVATLFASAQAQLDYKTIKDIVENEKQYYNDILNVYLNDDPYIRVDDYALVYYGQSFLPAYNGGNDKNEEALKSYAAEGKLLEQYETAKKILEYNPVSLNALFYAWRASEELIKPQEETNSYLKKYLGILDMITTMGDGKSSSTPFRVISPDDQDHILYGKLDIEKVVSRNLDTQTLCNIITVEPTEKFTSRRVYIDVSRYLSHTAKSIK
ncbi:MAG: DUF4919 domain-containing protein [Bacteroidaceae bacterium]|nr:DUF4919 domain-containing protein [Bacteroidaceae bacterium]MBR2415819.1 DUF4919 domain-containing protein [Bacteroidaceae bacterium]MBR3612633.1 DUF4919 domain-containing protein [Bacteroidaceae bacterium]